MRFAIFVLLACLSIPTFAASACDGMLPWRLPAGEDNSAETDIILNTVAPTNTTVCYCEGIAGSYIHVNANSDGDNNPTRVHLNSCIYAGGNSIKILNTNDEPAAGGFRIGAPASKPEPGSAP